jgi:uncharacterized protein
MNHSLRSFHEPDLRFRTINQKGLTFEDVFHQILWFMSQDPTGKYRLMIGSDSQVHGNETVFATVIVIHRKGKGAWAFLRKIRYPRRYENLYEKISTETSLTEEIASLFTEEHKMQMIDIVLPYIYKGSSFTIEGHIDIGSEQQNKTRIFIKEMVSRMQSAGLEPKIKPDSIAAYGVANRHTK